MGGGVDGLLEIFLSTARGCGDLEKNARRRGGIAVNCVG